MPKKKKESRILARKLARPLNEEEMQVVAGAMFRLGGALAPSSGLRLADTWSGTGCPEVDCDC